MGQKANTITIRKNLDKNLSFTNQAKDIQVVQRGFNFLNSVETLFSKKNVLVTKKELNLSANLINLNVTVFYDNVKLSKYKKRVQKIYSKSKSLSSNCYNISQLFTNRLTFFGTNLALINLKILNAEVDKGLVKDFYQRTAKFVNILFQRKFNLFIDFLKIASLFYDKKIQALIFLKILGQIFKVLPKKKHNRFLFFLKHIFQMLAEVHTSKSIPVQNQIRGVKFIISGKLQGKTRGSSSCIQIGSVPIQSIEKNIEFSKLHVHTLYGVFGFKIWVYRD